MLADLWSLRPEKSYIMPQSIKPNCILTCIFLGFQQLAQWNYCTIRLYNREESERPSSYHSTFSAVNWVIMFSFRDSFIMRIRTGKWKPQWKYDISERNLICIASHTFHWAADKCPCASSHRLLWITLLFRPTTLHFRHKIHFQIVDLWDDRLSVSQTSTLQQHCYIGVVVVVELTHR